MNIIYFTAGDTLLDGELRRQSLRIPEVLISVNQSPLKKEVDLLVSLLLDEEFKKLTKLQVNIFIQAAQEGLFERFCRARVPYAEIIRRRDHRDAAGAAHEILAHATVGEKTKVYVIGPGMDDVTQRLRGKSFEVIDVIANDPLLDWFWPEIKKAASG